jgi:hypothetical protein
MYKEKKISVTITSSRRLSLLERVLRSFKIFCKDFELIDIVIFFDDSSTSDEKLAMENLLSEIFVQQQKVITHYYPESISHSYRHAAIMNDLREKLRENNIDYTFHLEDDWLFINHFSLSECIDLLEEYPIYGQVGLNSSWKNFPDWINVVEIGNYWEWVYFPDRHLRENLFMDDAAAIQTLKGVWYWQTYINWPHFTLQPSIINCERLLSCGKFSIDYNGDTSLELEFAKEWIKRFKTLTSKNLHIYNLDIDRTMSAYELNGSMR